MDTFVETRSALHTVAEHLLAADLHRRTGRIGLRRTVGGFGQPEHLVDGVRRRMRVDGANLVVLRDDVESWHPIGTLPEAAAAADTAWGAPTSVFQPTTEAHADRLVIDAAAAERLARFFEFGERALERFRSDHPDRTPTLLQLWPEHFDLGCSFGEVNYGASPGDADHDEPYLYVGPWSPRVDPTLNESWGWSLQWDESLGLVEAVDFYEAGNAAAR